MTKSIIAKQFAELHLKSQGYDNDLIMASIEFMIPKIKPDLVSSAERLLLMNPDIPADKLVANIFRQVGGQVLNEDVQPTYTATSESIAKHVTEELLPPTIAINPPALEGELILKDDKKNKKKPKKKTNTPTTDIDVGDDTEDSTEDDLEGKSKYKSPATALYSHTPPKNIDFHPEMTLRTGLFRTLPTGKKHPALDENQIYELSKPLENGLRYMSMKGPVLNSGLDLTNYLCLTHWFGRMNKDQYEQAIRHGKTLTFEEFYSPIPAHLRPASLTVNQKMIDSFDRLKTIRLHFYPNLSTEDSEAMLSNLAGTIYPRSDGTIEIHPTLELRELYIKTHQLIPLNRASVVGLKSQIARLLAIWLAAKPGFTDTNKEIPIEDQWTKLNLEITVRDLLQEIHPKEAHYAGDVRLLDSALTELYTVGLIQYELIGRYQKSEKKKLTLSSSVRFTYHRLGNKNTFIMERLTEETKPKESKIKPHYEAGQILMDLKFYRYAPTNDEVCEWFKENNAQVERLISILADKSRSSLLEAREQLRGTRAYARTAFGKYLLAAQRKEHALYMDIISTNPHGKEQSQVETMIRRLPLPNRKKTIKDWYASNKTAINEIMTILRTSSTATQQFAAINKRVVYGRLITPLGLVGKASESGWLSGTFELGRESPISR